MSLSQQEIEQPAPQNPTAGVWVPRLRLLTLLAAAAGLAVALMLWATAKGIGLSADSVSYYSGAQSIAAGRGYSVLGTNGQSTRITSFPPGYSTILAGLELAGWKCLTAALPMHAVLLAMNVALAGVLVYRSAGGLRRPISAPLLGGAAALVMAGSTQVIEAHAHLWSEPLYLPLLLGSLIAMAAATGAMRRGAWAGAAWMAALAAGLAAACYLLRYAGISLIAYGGLVLVGYALARGGSSASHLKARLGRAGLLAALYGAITLFSLAYIAWHNADAGGAAIGRQGGWHPPGHAHWVSARVTLNGWFMPGGPFSSSLDRATRAALIAGGALLGLLAATALSPLARRAGVSEASPARTDHVWRALPAVLAGYALFYCLFLTISITLYDYATHPDKRILLPAFVCLLIAGLGCLGRWRLLDGAGGPYAVGTARCFVLVPLFALVVNVTAGGLKFATAAHEVGLGYSANKWQRMEIWADLAALPPDVVLWSNASDVIRLMRQQPARRLPMALDQTAPNRKTPAAGLEAGLKRLERTMIRESALVVFFDHVKSSRWMYLRPQQLEQQLDVEKLLVRPKATIYIHRRAARYQELKQWAQERREEARSE